MKRWVPLLFASVLCASCAVLAPDRFGYKYRNGAAEAKRDLAAGEVKRKIIGLPTESDRDVAEAWKRELGLEWDRIALCVVDQHIVRFVGRYNAVVDHFLDQKYGEDCVLRVRQQVRAAYYERQKKEQANKPAEPTALAPTGIESRACDLSLAARLAHG